MATEKTEKNNVTPLPPVSEEKKKTPKQLVLTGPDGRQYTLQFNRKVVLQMQRNGFTLDLDRLYMCARDLITGAFKMHHSWMKWEEIEAVWTHQNKRGELLGYLANMFSAPAIDLMGDGSDDEEADENPTFEIVW